MAEENGREEKKAAMNLAGEAALKDLEKVFSEASPEVQEGILFVAGWIENHYGTAGYKRLCRGIRSWLKVQQP